MSHILANLVTCPVAFVVAVAGGRGHVFVNSLFVSDLDQTGVNNFLSAKNVVMYLLKIDKLLQFT